MNVLTLGGVTQDVIIHYDMQHSCFSFSCQNQPVFACQKGAKIPVHRLEYACGGGAANSAVSFTRLSHTVTSCFSLGADTAADFIIQALQKQNITTAYKMHDALQTGTSFIIPSPDKDRVIFAYPGANNTFSFLDFTEPLSHTYDIVYLTSLAQTATRSLPTVLAQLKKINPAVLIACNPGKVQLLKEQQALKAALHSCDVMLVNTQEMYMFMQALKPRYFKTQLKPLALQEQIPLLSDVLVYDTMTFVLQDYFQELFSYGVKKAVVTDGARGVYVGTHNAIYFHPALSGTVVNTVGAGDAFGSAFVHALADHMTTQQALYAGLLQAQSVISYQDAQTGLLEKQILLKKLEKHVPILHTYSL